MLYVSIKCGVCVCVYTRDRGFLISHISLEVREMSWLHENHRVVGVLFGGGLLESAANGGGLLEVEADVSVGCVQGLPIGCLNGYLNC